MQLDPEEERNKSKKWGASRTRERAVATLNSTAVGMGVFLAAIGVEVVVLERLSVRGLLVGLIGAVVLGGAARAALMPRGQFGIRSNSGPGVETDLGTIQADGSISFEDGPALSSPRFHVSLTTVNGHVYVVGGIQGDGTSQA
jgi:hypothetical protein